MKQWIRDNFSRFEWLIGVGISVIALLAWGVNRDAAGGDISLLQLFPVFGLVAFGLLWSHYILGTVRRWSGAPKKKGDSYWIVSTSIVLALILLHPILLNIALIEAGFGLPPGSYFGAYGSADGWFIIPGVFALILFLLFELHRWHKNKSWWKWIERLQIVAMTGVFIHATLLGGEIAHSWYASLWWAMGLTLAAAWVYNWKYDKAHAPGGHDGGAKKH